MKALYRFFAALTLLAVCATPVSAQFRIGPRVGMNVNKMHFSKDVADSDNRSGFTAGLMAEFNLPILPFGFDASVLYSRHTLSVKEGNEKMTQGSDYIDVPISVKWRLGLPVVGKIISPYIFTGPQWSYLVGRRFFDDLKRKRSEMAWNLGVGLQLVSHLQVSANYSWGMTKTMENFNGKNRTWTITAAWLF